MFSQTALNPLNMSSVFPDPYGPTIAVAGIDFCGSKKSFKRCDNLFQALLCCSERLTHLGSLGDAV